MYRVFLLVQPFFVLNLFQEKLRKTKFLLYIMLETKFIILGEPAEMQNSLSRES